MKTFFYLQHPLMAMCDPRMKNLVKKEKLKGLGAYWFIMEKIAILPQSYFEFEDLRPFCKCAKISFAYIKKIILEYQLFDMVEEGFFMPEELNPPHKKEKKAERKTEKSTQENANSEPKNVENQQKTSKIQANPQKKESHNSLIDGDLTKNNLDIKENIRDITTTTTEEEKEEETAAAADVFVSTKWLAALPPESSAAPLPELPAALLPESPADGGENPPLTARIMPILCHNSSRWQSIAAKTAAFPEKPPQCRTALMAISPRYPAAWPVGTKSSTLKRQDESPPKRDVGGMSASVWNGTAQRPKPRSSTSGMTQLDGGEVRHFGRQAASFEATSCVIRGGKLRHSKAASCVIRGGKLRHSKAASCVMVNTELRGLRR